MLPDHDRQINGLPGGWGFGEGQATDTPLDIIEPIASHLAGASGGRTMA
jgi:hypothetical protein